MSNPKHIPTLVLRVAFGETFQIGDAVILVAGYEKNKVKFVINAPKEVNIVFPKRYEIRHGENPEQERPRKCGPTSSSGV